MHGYHILVVNQAFEGNWFSIMHLVSAIFVLLSPVIVESITLFQSSTEGLTLLQPKFFKWGTVVA